MKKILSVFAIACVLSAGILGALSVVPHAHGDDLDHSKHSSCPVYQSGLHDSSATAAVSQAPAAAFFVFMGLVQTRQDAPSDPFFHTAFLRAPPSAVLTFV